LRAGLAMIWIFNNGNLWETFESLEIPSVRGIINEANLLTHAVQNLTFMPILLFFSLLTRQQLRSTVFLVEFIQLLTLLSQNIPKHLAYKTKIHVAFEL
jgi:hypothetical protein